VCCSASPSVNAHSCPSCCSSTAVRPPGAVASAEPTLCGGTGDMYGCKADARDPLTPSSHLFPSPCAPASAPAGSRAPRASARERLARTMARPEHLVTGCAAYADPLPASVAPFWPEENCQNAIALGSQADLPSSTALSPFSAEFEGEMHTGGSYAGPSLHDSVLLHAPPLCTQSRCPVHSAARSRQSAHAPPHPGARADNALPPPGAHRPADGF